MNFTVRWTAEADKRFKDLQNRAKSTRANRKARGESKSSKVEGLFAQVQKGDSSLVRESTAPWFKHARVRVEDTSV